MNTARQHPAFLTDRSYSVLLAIKDLRARDISRRPPTQTQIAERLGCSVGTVNGYFRKLRDGGWIEFAENEPRSVRIVRRIPRRRTA